MKYLSYILIQLLVMLLVAPLVNGIIKKFKALSQKRQGPPLFQLYYDLAKLLRKDMVIAEPASWIFRATPYITFTSILLAALFVPFSTRLQTPGMFGDAILLVYLLALGRFFMALAGMDAGSTFGGMGSSREMMISSLIEPSLLVALVTLGLITKTTSIPRMMSTSATTGVTLLQPVYFLTFTAFMVILIAETARIPVDDPATHLELTMVHEAMLLEYSGRNLALMEWGAALKQLILITLMVNLFLPLDGLITMQNIIPALLVSFIIYLLKVILLALAVALIEINTVKLRLFSVPNLAALSFILAFLGFFQYFVLGR